MPKHRTCLNELAAIPGFENCPFFYRPAPGLEVQFNLDGEGRLRREGKAFESLR